MLRKIKIFSAIFAFIGLAFVLRELQREQFDFKAKCRKWRVCKKYLGQQGPLDKINSKHLESPLRQYFTFTNSYSVPTFVPFNVVIGVKKEFAGTASFYSCDMSEIRLLEADSGEFIQKVTYKIYAKQGQILTLGAEYYNRQHSNISFNEPPICGEVFPENKSHPFPEPYIKETGKEYYDSSGVECSVTELLDSLAPHNLLSLPEPFAVERAKKLLKVFPAEKTSPILIELISWISAGDKQPSTVELVKIVVERVGAKEAVPLLSRLLESATSTTRRIAVEMLQVCGKDAIGADTEIRKLLASEKDDEVLDAAIRLAKSQGIAIPLRYINPNDIPATKAAAHKNEIKDACDFAATLAMDQSYSYYGDNGKRVPIPEKTKKAMVRLETLIANVPKYPEMARVYFLLGKLKLKYAGEYNEDNNAPPAEIKDYAEEQYFHSECGAEYYYNGWHFNRLIKLFPNSDLIDKAKGEAERSISSAGCD